MAVYELRDAAEARRYLAEGLWLQRAAGLAAARVGPALRCALELAAAGNPMPPPGFLADLAHLVLEHGGRSALPPGRLDVPGWPAGSARAYEDLVLGRLDADPSIARAADSLARYRGRDRDRALAFLVDRIARRADAGGVVLNPAAPRAALETPPDELLATGWASLERTGVMPLLIAQYETLTIAIRDGAEALGPEDLFELEHGTALAAFGQRVALRQLLQCAAEFEAHALAEPPRRRDSGRQAASQLLDEDVYPVGGFASISTRGSIESLLHSQLAYMEPGARPDLFDIKFVRDELLYYSRDENQFLRRRRTFVVALFPGLARARVKDAALPHQRIILLLGLLVAAVRRLTQWLETEALRFEFLFVRGDDGEPLPNERSVLEMVLRESMARGLVALECVDETAIAARLKAHATRSLCHGLTVDTFERHIDAPGIDVVHLHLGGPRPVLVADPAATECESDDAAESWRLVQEVLLARWVGSA